MGRIVHVTLPYRGAFFFAQRRIGGVRPDFPMTSPTQDDLRKLALRLEAVSRGNLKGESIALIPGAA